MTFLWTIKYLHFERLRFCQTTEIPQQDEMYFPRGMEVGAVWKLGWGSGLSRSLLFLQLLWLVILEANRVREHVATWQREEKNKGEVPMLTGPCAFAAASWLLLRTAPLRGSGSRATCWRNLNYAS